MTNIGRIIKIFNIYNPTSIENKMESGERSLNPILTKTTKQNKIRLDLTQLLIVLNAQMLLDRSKISYNIIFHELNLFSYFIYNFIIRKIKFYDVRNLKVKKEEEKERKVRIHNMFLVGRKKNFPMFKRNT